MTMTDKKIQELKTIMKEILIENIPMSEKIEKLWDFYLKYASAVSVLSAVQKALKKMGVED